MKKILMMILAAAMALSMAACGSTPAASSSQAESESVASESEAAEDESLPDEAPVEDTEEPADEDGAEPTEGDAAATGDLAAYTEQMQQMADSMTSAYGDALKMDISTAGNQLIMTYTLADDSLGLTADAISTSMAAAEETFNTLATSMQTGGLADASIVIKWIGADGSELYNKEFK